MEPSENTNKKRLSAFLRQYPRGHVMAASSLFVGLALVLALSSTGGEAKSERQSQPLTLNLSKSEASLDPETAPLLPTSAEQSEPETSATVVSEPPEPASELARTTYTVKSGDSLSVLFKRAGLTDRV